MTGTIAPLFWTKDMIIAMPDDRRRYECVYGELLVTSFVGLVHQRVLGRLMHELGRWLDTHPVGVLYPGPADISWGPDILVKPDLFVATREEAHKGEWEYIKTLLLVIEVLEPSTARQDRFTKRRLYQEVGIPAAWFVDCEAQHIEVWTPEATFPVFERERATWAPAGAAEPLVIEVPALFQPV